MIRTKVSYKDNHKIVFNTIFYSTHFYLWNGCSWFANLTKFPSWLQQQNLFYYFFHARDDKMLGKNFIQEFIQEKEGKVGENLKHNRCYRFKFRESISGGNVLDDRGGHLCPTEFQLVLSMEFWDVLSREIEWIE